MAAQPAKAASPTMATMAARTALPLVHEWRRRSEDPRPLLEAAGVDEAQLRGIDARIGIADFLALHAAFTEASGDEAFALEALASLEHAAFPMLLHLASSQGTVLSGIAFAAPFVRSLLDDLEFELDSREDRLRASFRRAGAPLSPPVVAEYLAALLVAFLRLVAPEAPPPSLVALPHEAPRHGAALARYFGCELRFGAETLRLEVPVPSVSIPSADPELGRLLASQAEGWLPRAEAPSVRERTRRYLATQLTGEQAIAVRAAEALGMSERSLRRHLQLEGTSLREVVAELRLERALTLLDAPAPNLNAIALELGYESATAFGRAFRSWTGKSPGELRRARRASS